ncbi:MAG: DUF3299 domain-containing protein [Candidatus Hydrogenedentes bacterium]|nr:DUF3299 domain-containing protein [Candidatus Hydrogenedentota bacterium]
MRKRAKRELGVIVGILALLAAGVSANYVFGLSGKVEFYTTLRQEAETTRQEQGLDLLSWETVTETGGNRFSGPQFEDAFLARDGQTVNILGFMTPINRYRDMTEFILLPLPIECYFCQTPPMNHVVWVKMKEGEKTNLFKEPVLINGTLKLAGVWDEAKYFYSIQNATLGAGELGGKLTVTAPGAEHMVPQHQQNQELLRGTDPPKPSEFQ